MGWGGAGLAHIVARAVPLLLMSGLRHIQNDKLAGSLLLNPHCLAPPAKLNIFPGLRRPCKLDFHAVWGRARVRGWLSLQWFC